MNNEHIVLFHEYCNKCEYFRVSGDEEPCDKCLSVPARIGSCIPIHFKEAKNEKSKR